MKAIDNFIQYIRSIRGYSENTCQAYERDLRQFVGWMQQRDINARWSSVTRKDIDMYIVELHNKGKKPATTNRSLASIASIYRYFQRENMIENNPVKFESRRKIAETIPNTIPVADIKRAIKWNAGVSKFMLQILLTTGIRLQEMLDMTWEDIDFENNKIRIHGKGQRDRQVYTTAETLDYLRPHRTQTTAHGKIFYMQQRKAREIIYEALHRYTRAKQVSPHAIRHTFATELAKAGLNNTEIKTYLGHKRLDTTQKYIDMAQIETGQRCLDIINNLK